MAITGDPLKDTTGDGARGAKKGFRHRLVTLLAQQDIDKVPRAIDRAVEIGPASFHFEVGFVDIPAASSSSPSLLAQRLAQQQGELRFPLPHRFMREDWLCRKVDYNRLLSTIYCSFVYYIFLYLAILRTVFARKGITKKATN